MDNGEICIVWSYNEERRKKNLEHEFVARYTRTWVQTILQALSAHLLLVIPNFAAVWHPCYLGCSRVC
jgi:hypothetical protein